MRPIVLALASMLAGVPASGAAAPDPAPAQAATVQPPVWVERAGARRALAAGAPLYPGDRLLTGSEGRLHLQLADASVVKLGSDAEFQFPELRLVPDGSREGLLKGALKVVRGAFRFTTGALGVLRRRELDVYVGPTITAGIRGTDIWGKSDESRALLCLIEGEIQVSSPGQPTQVMDQPSTFYVVPRDKAPLPIEPTPPGQLEKWALQTEMRPETPAMSVEARYVLGLASLETADAARREARRLSDAGYAAEIVEAQVGRRTWYRLVLRGFASSAEAAAYGEAVKHKLRVRSPWVIQGG